MKLAFTKCFFFQNINCIQQFQRLSTSSKLVAVSAMSLEIGRSRWGRSLVVSHKLSMLFRTAGFVRTSRGGMKFCCKHARIRIILNLYLKQIRLLFLMLHKNGYSVPSNMNRYARFVSNSPWKGRGGSQLVPGPDLPSELLKILASHLNTIHHHCLKLAGFLSDCLLI